MVQPEDKIAKLARNAEYAKLFQVLADRELDRRETRIDVLARDAGVHYSRVAMKWARALDKANIAQLIQGRRGGTTRLAWSRGISLTEVGQYAGMISDSDDDDSVEEEEIEATKEEHQQIATVPIDTFKSMFKEAMAEFFATLATLQRPGDGKP